MGKVVQFLSIILLILIIYFAMIYQNKREGFYEDLTPPPPQPQPGIITTTTTTTTTPTTTIPETQAVVNPLEYPGGIAIKQSSTGRYLMQNDDGSLTFTGLRLSSEFDIVANKQLDKCKFTLTQVGTTTPPRYKIKSNGHKLGQSGGNELYWKSAGTGASATFISKVRANSSFDDADLFTLTIINVAGDSTNNHIVISTDGVELANNTYKVAKLKADGSEDFNLANIYVEHYIPTYLKTKDGDFSSTIGPNGIKGKQIYNCVRGPNLVDELRVNNSAQCSRKCVESGNCNHFVYNYLRPRGKNNCSLYENCTGDNLVLDYDVRNNNNRGIIMNNVGMNSLQRATNQQQQELINSRLQTYDDSMQLMDENIKLMDKIKEKVEEINDMEIRGDSNAYDHVMNHNNVVGAINDPQNLSTLRHNIKTYIQKSTITNLEEQLAELEKLNEIKARTGSLSNEKAINEIKSIQNVNNARSLNVYLPDDIPKNDKSKHEYMVFANGKCLSYDKDGKAQEYDFVDCNRRDDKQLFKIDKVGGTLAFNNKVANPIHKIDSTQFETLGFYAVSPKEDDKQCMTLNDDGLVIRPCDLNSEQRYHVSDNIVSC